MDIQKIVVFARIGFTLVELGAVEIGKIRALLASDGQDDEALQDAVARLDSAIERAKAEAGG